MLLHSSSWRFGCAESKIKFISYFIERTYQWKITQTPRNTTNINPKVYINEYRDPLKKKGKYFLSIIKLMNLSKFERKVTSS